MRGGSREGKRARFILSLSSSSPSPGIFCCLQLSRCGHMSLPVLSPGGTGGVCTPPSLAEGAGTGPLWSGDGDMRSLARQRGAPSFPSPPWWGFSHGQENQQSRAVGFGGQDLQERPPRCPPRPGDGQSPTLAETQQTQRTEAWCPPGPSSHFTRF